MKSSSNVGVFIYNEIIILSFGIYSDFLIFLCCVDKSTACRFFTAEKLTNVSIPLHCSVPLHPPPLRLPGSPYVRLLYFPLELSPILSSPPHIQQYRPLYQAISPCGQILFRSPLISTGHLLPVLLTKR